MTDQRPPEPAAGSIDRVQGGQIVACSDEGFAEAANLLAARAPRFRHGVFIEGKGQQFDSWETRRHNPDPPDWVIIALGTPGPLMTVDVDTHWHDGNHAARAALLGARCAPGEPPPTRGDACWVPLLPPVDLDGHAHNVLRLGAGAGEVDWTHVLLENHPDGGIARLRCYSAQAPDGLDPGEGCARRVRHAEPIPGVGDREAPGPTTSAVAAAWDALAPDAPVDLASAALGGRVVGTSNNRYGHSQQLLASSAPVSMGDGWETSRSRAPDHHDHVTIALARPGRVEAIEVDFTWFVLNNPVALRVLGARLAEGDDPDDAVWQEVVARTPVKALAGGRLRVDAAALVSAGPFSHVRLETYPDGGANRLRVIGRPGA